MTSRYAEGWQAGDCYVICDYCGFRNRYSQTSLIWNNMRVCNSPCYEATPSLVTWKVPSYPHEGQALPDCRPDQQTETLATGTTSTDWLINAIPGWFFSNVPGTE